MKRVLICANPDLNYIDGSSVWAQTFALALAATGSAQVDFMAKSPPVKEEIFGSLRAANNLIIIEPKRRLTLQEMSKQAAQRHHDEPYDVVVVRGLEIAKALLDYPALLKRTWLYLTDIPQCLEKIDSELKKQLIDMAEGCSLLLCQTKGFVQLWQSITPGLSLKKIKIYSPVIPDLPSTLKTISERPLQAIYAGKFKSDWMTLEMTKVWPIIHKEIVTSELVMIGDKIHDEPGHPSYKKQMHEALLKTQGLKWLGAQPRETVQKYLQEARVGLSWRHEGMNTTVEYSTKLLEYGGAGCAAIVNRNPLHEDLLGKDYPLYANTTEEFKSQLKKALTQPQVAQTAADRLKKLAESHTFSQRVKEINRWLKDMPPLLRRTRVLVAGHDLKFFTLLQKKLEATGQFVFLIDQWQGHNNHDEAKSRGLLEKADVIFCEWCLGNLKWYSHNKRPNQRLVARFHLQERELPYVTESKWENIDHISYVSEFIRREGQKAFSFPFKKTSVIPNLLDEEKFTPKRKTSDARYTLGIIGVAPARKRLDRAVDLLESLLEDDDRYCLRVKGKSPLDYSWLLKRKDELDYYRDVFGRINSNPKLRYKVVFDPPGDDVNDWFTMVGFILSPSDFESFHMAIGEGMLTGAMPIIWNWDGADEIWGDGNVISSICEAKKKIINTDISSEDQKFRSSILQPSNNIVDMWVNHLLREE